MASVTVHLRDANEIFNEIQQRADDAEDNMPSMFVAARGVQRWVRGFLERQHIKRLNGAALLLQRHWRGYCGRQIYLMELKRATDDMYRVYYDGMTTIIQKWWRGYYIRTRIFCYYALKNWLKLVVIKNQSLLHEMKNYHDAVDASSMDTLEKEAKDWVMFILFKLHHLLRTQVLPGIYSLHNTTELSVLEQQLNSLKYKEFLDILHKQRRAMRMKLDSTPPPKVTLYEKHKQCEIFWHNRIRFNKPTLKAQEKYVDWNKVKLEEEKRKNWVLEIQDQPMKYPMVRYDRTYPKIEQGPYMPAKYALRQTDPKKNISQSKFNSYCRPIELFDYLKTYDYCGPYTPLESKTELFIKRHQERCDPSMKSKKKEGLNYNKTT